MGEMTGDLISQIFNLGYGGGTLLLLSLLSVVVGLVYLKKYQEKFKLVYNHFNTSNWCNNGGLFNTIQRNEFWKY